MRGGGGIISCVVLDTVVTPASQSIEYSHSVPPLGYFEL